MKNLDHVVGSHNNPMVIKMDVANFSMHKVLVDNRSSIDVLFLDVLRKVELEVTTIQPIHTPLVGFGGTKIMPLGTVDFPVSFGTKPRRKTIMVKFLVVGAPFAYNVILGRPGLNLFQAVVSTFHLEMKFPTRQGVGEVCCNQREVKECYKLSLKKRERNEVKEKRRGDMARMRQRKTVSSIQDIPKLEPQRMVKTKTGRSD